MKCKKLERITTRKLLISCIFKLLLTTFYERHIIFQLKIKANVLANADHDQDYKTARLLVWDKYCHKTSLAAYTKIGLFSSTTDI